MGAGNKQRHPPLNSTVADKGLQTSDFGLWTLEMSFDLSDCVPTPALMDGGNGKRELHYILYEITCFFFFLGIYSNFEIWPSRLKTSRLRQVIFHVNSNLSSH